MYSYLLVIHKVLGFFCTSDIFSSQTSCVDLIGNLIHSLSQSLMDWLLLQSVLRCVVCSATPCSDSVINIRNLVDYEQSNCSEQRSAQGTQKVSHFSSILLVLLGS